MPVLRARHIGKRTQSPASGADFGTSSATPLALAPSHTESATATETALQLAAVLHVRRLAAACIDRRTSSVGAMTGGGGGGGKEYARRKVWPDCEFRPFNSTSVSSIFRERLALTLSVRASRLTESVPSMRKRSPIVASMLLVASSGLGSGSVAGHTASRNRISILDMRRSGPCFPNHLLIDFIAMRQHCVGLARHESLPMVQDDLVESKVESKKDPRVARGRL